MGCTMASQNGLLLQRADNSSSSATGASSRMFKVTNVDNNGEDRNPGYIEITTDSLVLHQRDKESVAWPLHGLRRYGFDADLFSFESGRRCPTGPGIYAFRCRRAEALFSLLQSSIVVAGQTNGTAVGSQRGGAGLVETARRLTAGLQATPNNAHQQLMFLQPVAVVRPLQPPAAVSHPHVMPSQYHNVPGPHVNLAGLPRARGGHAHRHPEHVHRQSLAQLPDILAMYSRRPTTDQQIHYAELDLDRHVDEEEYIEGNDDDDDDDGDVFAATEHHLPYDEQVMTTTVNINPERTENNPSLGAYYVNFGGAEAGHLPTAAAGLTSTSRHGYANLDLIADSAAAASASDAAGSLTRVNYIQLDLSTETLDEGASPGQTPAPTARMLSLTQRSGDVGTMVDSYTTIDFDRTRALNTISVESLGIADEGVRRTRHNSSIV